MKNKKVVENMLMKKFGVGLEDVVSKTKDQALSEKVDLYEKSDVVKRAVMFGIEAEQNESYKRIALSVIQDAVELGKFVITFEELPEAANRKTMDFFREIFPDFDINASKSFGRHFAKNYKYLAGIPAALQREGEGIHLSWLVMNSLMEKSTNRFFGKIRRNKDLNDLFKERLDKYCMIWWEVAMLNEGTFNNHVTDTVKSKGGTGDFEQVELKLAR